MPDTGPTTTDLITVGGVIATPIFLIVLSGIGWVIKGRIEATQEAEAESRRRAEKLDEELRSDRLQIYNDILEPFIIALSKDGTSRETRTQRKGTGSFRKGEMSKEQRVSEIMHSVEYRQAGFRLSLFANDSVFRAYNNLMQSFYNMENTAESMRGSEPSAAAVQMLNVFSAFLLEIRKSVGNEKSSLSNMEMLEWMISDFDKLKGQLQAP